MTNTKLQCWSLDAKYTPDTFWDEAHYALLSFADLGESAQLTLESRHIKGFLVNVLNLRVRFVVATVLVCFYRIALVTVLVYVLTVAP